MGEVWRGEHSSGAPVAVKVLTPDGASRRMWLEGLHAEIRAVAGLDHRHIVWIHDAGVVGEEEADASHGRLVAGGPWFAMELADGGTLRDRYRAITSWDQARGLLASLLRALAHAHARGIVHRDIKPANVLFAGDVPKLSDFGMVFSVEPDGEDVPAGGGTPAYMAPEQFEGERWDLGPWTDLYALGCLSFAVVTGRRPFPGTGWVRLFNAHWNAPIPTVEPRFELPEGFEDWLHAMMAKDRHHRYQRAADALHALQQLDEPTTASLRAQRRSGPLSSSGRRPAYPRPPLPHFRERLTAKRENLAVGLGLYGLRAMPFVGRNRERTRLWELLAAMLRDRKPRAVVLRGPAGVGKSRLAEWLTQRTHEVGAAATFKATHAPLPSPLDGLPGLLARALRVWNSDRDTLQVALAEELEPRGLRDPGVHKALANILVPDGELEISGRRRHALVTRAMAALATQRPSVVWLDDVQWGHDAVDFADHLLTAERAPPALIVLTVREDVLADEPEASAALSDLLEHERAEEISLAPLERRASVELIERGLHLRPELARKLHERIHGNPMFAVELVGDWVERRLLVPTDRGFDLASERPFRTPDSVGAVWQGRLEQLFASDPSAEAPLAVAAALGMEIDFAEWQRACAAARLAVPADFWGRLQELRLARRDPEVARFTFVHGTLRDQVLERAERDGTLAGIHRAIAQAVEDDGRKGTHLLRAGEIDQAVHLLLESAESTASADMRSALRLLVLRDEALEALDAQHPARIDGWLVASRVTRAASRPAEALSWGEKALELSQIHGDRERVVRSLQCICSAQRMLGDLDAARRAVETALHLSTGLSPHLRAETIYQSASILLDRGDLQGCVRTLRRALQLEQEPTRRIRSLTVLGYALAQTGQVQEALTALREVLPLAEAEGDRACLSDLHNVLGEVERVNGRDDRAEEHYRKALDVVAGSGNVAPACRANLAQLLLRRGETREARAMLERVKSEAHDTGARILILVAHAGLAACDVDLRCWDGLERHLSALERDPGGLAVDDLASCLRYAGTHALVFGKVELGRRALTLAADQYAQLGRDDEANDLRELL